jgi:hypothetical protein
MSDIASSYCVASVIRDPNRGEAEVTTLGSFDQVVAYLRDIHAWFADLMADIRAQDETPDGMRVGGFGVQLRNRLGGVVEVGTGRDVWFLLRSSPEPTRCYSDNPPLEGDLSFWLGGWHHTELGRHMLVSRVALFEALQQWLESGEFPESKRGRQISRPECEG